MRQGRPATRTRPHATWSISVLRRAATCPPAIRFLHRRSSLASCRPDQLHQFVGRPAGRVQGPSRPARGTSNPRRARTTLAEPGLPPLRERLVGNPETGLAGERLKAVPGTSPSDGASGRMQPPHQSEPPRAPAPRDRPRRLGRWSGPTRVGPCRGVPAAKVSPAWGGQSWSSEGRFARASARGAPHLRSPTRS